MEYTVFLTQQPNTPWRAVVHELPDCVVEAPTRAEALEKIQQRILAIVSHTEVLRLQIPATPAIAGRQGQAASPTPWHWFGAFQTDPVLGSLFDEIERQRDAQILGG